MVGPVHLPSGVAQFVTAHVATVEHLELLLLLMQTRERWWDAASVSSTLGLRVDAARRALDHLAAHNLLAIRVTGDVRYQFQPGASALAHDAALFAEAFRLNPLAVLQLIPQPSRRSIHDFANAFKLRRDDDR